jgi:membrane protease YdiL (CAAX protease family)
MTGRAITLAPLWHTRVLVSVLLLAPLTSLLVGREGAPPVTTEAQVSRIYVPLLLANLLFVVYVARVGLRRSIFWELFGRLRGASQVLREAGYGLAFALALFSADSALQHAAGWPESLGAHALLPQSASAKLCWVALAACVGSGEELVYRGYLQRQFTGLTGSAAAGITIQAVLFAIAHGEQGTFTVVRFTVFALALGWLANARQNLLAVVACHCALDLYAGLWG